MEIGFVRDAVEGADLIALRTALYQATGDPSVLDVRVGPVAGSALHALVVDERDRAALKERAVRYLTEELPPEFTGGAEAPPPSEPDLRFLLELTLGTGLTDEEYEINRVLPAFDEFPREVRWSSGSRPRLPEGFHVAVVGAGISGVAMGVQLSRLGIPFTVYERRAEVGGTWSRNTYPDARVDTASSTYEYRFVKKHRWTEYFARQPEVRQYIETVAKDFGVFGHIRFDHDVVAAEFDEAASCWRLTVRRSDGQAVLTTATAVVAASGLFATPKPVDIPGAGTFGGELLHTTDWGPDHSAAGRTVAVIGNGSTGVQLLARIADEARQVHVFQRTPQWISPRPRYGQPITPGEQWLLDTMPYYWNWTRVTPLIPATQSHDLLVPDPEWQRGGGLFNKPNDALRAMLTQYIEARTGGRRDLVERLVPDYPPLARRLVVDNGWYDTLTRDHVELVTDPIARIDPDSVVTADGTRRPVDMIVAAVGFSVTKYLWPTEYRGRAGVRLEDRWQMADGGPRAFAGITVPEFPNLFILYGPNSQPTSGGLGLHGWIEIWTSYIAQSLVTMIEQGHRRMEVRRSAFDAYNERIDSLSAQMIWADPGSSKQNYYVNENGRLQVVNPLRGVELFELLRTPRPEHYHFG